MNNQEALLSYFREQIGSGLSWAACKDAQLQDDIDAFTFFGSSIEAEKHCEHQGFYYDQDGELTEYPNFSYYPAANLLLEYQHRYGTQLRQLTSVSAMTKLVEEAGMHLGGGVSDTSREVALLTLGMVVSAGSFRPIVPARCIDGYHLVAHRHDYTPTIYELGHSAQVLSTVDTWMAASEMFHQHAAQMPKNGRRSYTELLIVGSFQGKTLQLDYEGCPALGTGITFATACYQGEELMINVRCEPDKQMALEQRYFTQYDKSTGKLLSLDERLRPIAGQQQLHHYFTGSFRPTAEMDDEQLRSLTQKNAINVADRKSARAFKRRL